MLEGLWGPDLRMRDPGLGVGVCPDEAPRSPVWGPLRMPPVTCGGLSLALELPALIRQLRAAWRARRGGPLGHERSQASTWVEAGKEDIEELKHDIQDRSAHLEGNRHIIHVYKCSKAYGSQMSDQCLMANVCFLSVFTCVLHITCKKTKQKV